MLPAASRAGTWTSFFDALFTATSVVCVTGLVIHDTVSYWSAFGQLVILFLIQIGGMGVITVAAAFAMVSGRKISLMQRSTMQEAIAAPKVGGIGFLTWDDLRTNRLHFHKYRMQSKVILWTTAILLFVPAVYFYFCEFVSLAPGERILVSAFQAVTPRTAGFNTVDLTGLSEAGQWMIIVLMLIGVSPGSTAGGMKTTTVAVLFATALSTFRQKEDTNFFGRRIETGVVRNAATIFLMYLVLFFTGGLFISIMEGLPMLTCLFETASAVGTVGLTLVFAALSGIKKTASRFPQEKITVR